MLCLYVGYSRNFAFQQRETRGNVEGSQLRMYIAKEMGSNIKCTERPNGNTKKRIDLPNPQEGEDRVSEYICSGSWKYVICQSLSEAKDFKQYVIDQLEPRFNKRQSWKREKLQRYEYLYSQLKMSKLLSYRELMVELSEKHPVPCVHVFYHEEIPSRY